MTAMPPSDAHAGTIGLGQPGATGQIAVAAPPERVYALVTDLRVLAELGEEVRAHRWVGRPGAAVVGARFRGSNRRGARRWRTTARVTAADPGRCFAFEVSSGPLPVSVWRYDIRAAADGGCLVVESTWDRRPRWFRGLTALATGVRERTAVNDHNIARTLSRLKERAER
ncbi:SRPBCC family protein [Streptomyces buecherae]|uniref:SRPBCC family protein n=1 Tax=Streptomyces buecherae TaxID=2763006 RepID=UPI003654254F